MQKPSRKRQLRPRQEQRRPGKESRMRPPPVVDYPDKTGSNKLKGKIALITGGDSGIGKAVSILFAKEGASIAIVYLNEHIDAKKTAEIITTTYGQQCLLLPGNITREKHCTTIIKKVIARFGKIDVLVNNAGLHYVNKKIGDISSHELIQTFETNFFPYFWLSKAAIPFMKKGSSIINTSSVTAYRGSAGLIDYSATKGAIVSFTRSLSASLVKKGIRVNGVAPGPVWTPLIASSLPGKKVAEFGSDSPMGRAAEPAEIAPAYLFLASGDANFISGQFIHPNGGEIING